MPGCAELGDVDPTSSTVAIMACDEKKHLEPEWVGKTFNFYFTNFVRRLVPGHEETFTPYEARNADALVRLGER